MPRLNELISVFESLAPSILAEPWDNVGLQIGNPSQKVSRILVSLNASPEVIQEASEKKCQLLFTHHPLFFQKLQNLLKGTLLYEVVKKALNKKISIYSAHTNLDKASIGLNKVLADFLKIKGAEPLVADTAFKKLVFFAEPKDSLIIIEKLSLAGAGIIGRYSHASFRSPGIGTFVPEAGAKPTVGKAGKLNEVKEERVEMLVHQSILTNVVDSLREIHPYEEVAYDIYPLEDIRKSHLGMGRIGHFDSEKSVEAVAEDFKKATDSSISFVGDYRRKVKKVAVVAGAGASYIELAYSKGAELLVTSDVKYHEALQAKQLGLNLLIASHYALEKLALKLVSPSISDTLKKAGYTVEILNSEKESDAWFEISL